MPTAIQTALRFDTIDELRESTDPLARRVAKAADAKRPTGAEGEALERIEQVRTRLLADETEIEVQTYGPGSASAPKTREEMDAG